MIWPKFQIVALKSSLTKLHKNCDIANHLFVTTRTRFRDFAKQIHWNLSSPSFIKIVILHQIVQNQAALCLEIKMKWTSLFPMFLRFSHFKAVSDAMYAILKYEFALFFVLKPSRCAETMCATNLSIFTLFSIVQYFELDYYRSRCAKTMCAINFALFALFSILYYLHYFQFCIICTIFNFALFALFSILHNFAPFWLDRDRCADSMCAAINFAPADDHYFASALLCPALLLS